MSISALAIKYPRVLAVIGITIVCWGLVAFWTMPRREDPALTWRLANVVTRLPGTSAHRVESEITDVLERFVQDVDEVEHIYSVSRPGLSLLQIELEDQVTDAGPIWQRVRQKLQLAESELPEAVVGPELDDEIMGTFTVLVAVASKDASHRELEDHAKSLERQLRYLPGTASTSLFGQQDEVVHVDVEPALIAAHELTFESVADAIRNRNTRTPAGRARVGQNELVIEGSGEFNSEHELASMVVMTADSDKTLLLGDIATIQRTISDPPLPLARFNGIPAIFVGARARGNLRTDQFGLSARAVIEQFKSGVPNSISVEIAHDEASYTSLRMSQLSKTILIGVILVFLSAAIFMGWKAGLVVTMAIPLTGLLVLILLMGMGVPLQQMSVMGIIMAFGLLVDDAVVVTEHIHRKVSQGVAVPAAAATGPAELFGPLVVTTLTTIAAFLPIYLLPGGTGEFVRSIPIAVSSCLMAALLIAMAAIPAVYARFLGTDAATNRRATSISSTDWFQRWIPRLEHLLTRVTRCPVRSITIIALTMTLIASLGLTLRRDFFSPVQRDEFVIDVFAAQGISLESTDKIVRHIESILDGDESVVSTMSFVGRNAPLVFYNLTSQETYANHFAQLIVRVDHWSETERVAKRIQRALDIQVTDATCCAHIFEHGAPFVAPFELRVTGPSIPILRELAGRGAEVMGNSPGVRNVRHNYGREAPRVVSVVNEPVAKHLGLSHERIAQQLQYRFDGVHAGHLQEDDRQIDIVVRLPRDRRRRLSDLTSVAFQTGPNGRYIPFRTVASQELRWETASIYRRDRQRTITVTGYPRFGQTPAQVSRAFEPWLDSLASTVPTGYSLEFGGESEQRREAESRLVHNGVYAFFLILLLLIIQFRSFRLTGLILFVVPLSMSGAMLGLWLTGWPLNFMALMGMMMLAGVVVNDAVILVDGFERRRMSGQAIDSVVIKGTIDRARHIVITTITTIAGFLPLALSPSLLWPPLAIAIIGGLSMATLITLIGIPAAYLLLRRGAAAVPQPDSSSPQPRISSGIDPDSSS